jgi:hypothetical protein
MSELPPTAETSISDKAWKALENAYDLHVHVAPDIIERRIDDIDLAKDFLSKNMRGFVLKSHYIPTAERARVVSKAVPGATVYGGMALNHSIGGLNPLAIEIAGRGGCKIIWMPTVDAKNETAGRPEGGNEKLPFWAKIQRELAAIGIYPPPITILDESGDITKTVHTCLDIIARHDMILATGHLGRHEIYKLALAARDHKLRKLLVTHAEFPSQNLSASEQTELVSLGALIEHCYTTMYLGKASWETVIANIRSVGFEHSVLSTDSGQLVNPPVTECFGTFAQKLLDAGFAVEEIHCMAAKNPEYLLG